MLENYQKAVDNIREDIKTYITKNNIKSLVLGVSGGIDSALCAVLAEPICKELNFPLLGYSIRIQTNKDEEISRAKNIGENFCSEFKEIDLSNLFLTTVKELENEEYDQTGNKEYKIRMGNIKARLRMIYLYNQARKNNGLVLSTDNYTELLLGFWTLHGDVGDFGMIQKLWKTEVYGMSRYLADIFKTNNETDKAAALIACVEAVPTDGLGITNSDLDQLGANSYEEVDKILIEFLQSGQTLNKDVIGRHTASQFKRDNPYNTPREIIKE
jgi:NAD+ synthetase